MARWYVVAIVALAIIQTTVARNVPEDHAAGLSDQKNFILGGFAGNNGGDPTGSGIGAFGGFDGGVPGDAVLPGFGGDNMSFGGGDGTGIFPGLGGSPGSSTTGGGFGSFPLP